MSSRPPRSKSSSAQNQLKEEELRKRMRTARREKALKALLHTYDLRGADPEEAMRVAEMLDDIGTRSASPTHLLYVPKSPTVKEIKSSIVIDAVCGMPNAKTMNLKNDAVILETTKKRFNSRIEKMKDKIEACAEDIEFMRSQQIACLERTASHNLAPRAQDSDAVVILPVTGAHNCSTMNQRMLGRSLEILKRRTMTKRAEHNDAVGGNENIKYEIDNLRRERTTFIKIINDLCDELNHLKTEVKNTEGTMDETQRERDDLVGEYNQVINEWGEKCAEYEAEYDKMGKAQAEQERLDKLARNSEEKARREERNRQREEAKAERAREREAQAISVAQRNQTDQPSPGSSPNIKGASLDESTLNSSLAESKKRAELQPDVMLEMVDELSKKWNNILEQSGMAKLRTEMDESGLASYLLEVLQKDDDNRFRCNKEMQNEKNQIQILEKELLVLTRTLKSMEEGAGNNSADAGTRMLVETLGGQVAKLEKSVMEGISSYKLRKDDMSMLADQVNTCYLRAGGPAMEDSDAAGASPNKARSGETENDSENQVQTEEDVVIDRLVPADFKVLSQLGYLEDHLKSSIQAYALKAFETPEVSSPSESVSSSFGGRRASQVFRRATAESRLGEMSIRKPLTTANDRVPRVDIPDDMDTAIGLGAEEQMNDTPFNRAELEQRYESNLSRIRAPAHANSSTMQDSTNSLPSVGAGIGLIDAKEQMRQEQLDLYRRIAMGAIEEQAGNTRMRKRFISEQNGSGDEEIGK
jgi:hypothetical protein